MLEYESFFAPMLFYFFVFPLDLLTKEMITQFLNKLWIKPTKTTKIDATLQPISSQCHITTIQPFEVPEISISINPLPPPHVSFLRPEHTQYPRLSRYRNHCR